MILLGASNKSSITVLSVRTMRRMLSEPLQRNESSPWDLKHIAKCTPNSEVKIIETCWNYIMKGIDASLMTVVSAHYNFKSSVTPSSESLRKKRKWSLMPQAELTIETCLFIFCSSKLLFVSCQVRDPMVYWVLFIFIWLRESYWFSADLFSELICCSRVSLDNYWSLTYLRVMNLNAPSYFQGI